MFAIYLIFLKLFPEKKKLFFSAEFAKKRWLQLRDRYRKELKIAIAQNFSQPQKWNHFALLKWLDPHLQGGV